MCSMYGPVQKEKLQRLLATEPFGVREYFVFSDIAFCGHMTREMLLGRVARIAQDYEELHPFDASDAKSAFDLLLREGFIQEIDSSALAEIKKFLSQDTESLGPIEDLPALGIVSLTRKGADLCLRIDEEVFGWPPETYECAWAREVDSRHVQVFGTTRAVTAEIFYDGVFHGYKRVVWAGDVEEIGPWRAKWWRKRPRGWRIDAEVEGGPWLDR